MNGKPSAYDGSKSSENFLRETYLDGDLTGWILHEHTRSKNKKHKDKYWFSPKTRKKLRSRVEVRAFTDYLQMYGSDKEEEAWHDALGKKRPKPQKKNDAGAVAVKINKKKSTKKKISSSSKSRKVSDCDDELLGLTQRKKSQTIQESKQCELPAEKKQKLAILTAFDKYKLRMDIEKPDHMSAFDMNMDSEPKGDGGGTSDLTKSCKGTISSKNVNIIPSTSEKKRNISESKAGTKKINCIKEAKGIKGQSSPSFTPSVPEIAESKGSDESVFEILV